MRRLSITPGEKRNRLTLVREVEPDEKRNALVECRCECGETTVVRFHSFINGIVQSCGCLVRDGREHITLEPGARSGRLTFLRELPKSDNKRWIEVRCDCGNVRTIFFYSFNLGHSRSCGCLRLETVRKHGLSQTPIYHAWASILQRCYNPKHPHFRLWGGRGITVCPEWRESFDAFYQDMGPRPSSLHSIDRIDNDGNYEKTNCRWTTKDVNTTNRRGCSFLDFRGEQVTFKEARRRTGLSKAGLRYRLKTGWTLERLLTTSFQSGQDEPYEIPSYLSMSESNGAESPNSKTHKRVTSGISWDATTGYLNIQWSDGQSTSYNLGELNQEIQNALMYFGALARVQQSYTTCAGNPVVARQKAEKLWSMLAKGDWGLRSGERSHSITIQALAVLLKTSEAEAAARFAALPVEKRREVSNRSDVVAKISQLKAKAHPQESLESILK